MKQDKLQMRIIAFVGKCVGWYQYQKEQIIGLTMIEYNLFYDEARKRVESALSEIK